MHKIIFFFKKPGKNLVFTSKFRYGRDTIFLFGPISHFYEGLDGRGLVFTIH